MRGQRPKELEQLERGLQEARPLDDLLQKLAADNEAKDLYAKGLHYVCWTGHMMAVAGIYFLALKEKVGHGNFKKMFIGKNIPVSYMHVWQCMKAAHVVAEHRVFGELRTSRAFLNLMLLPKPDQDALASEVKGIPGDQVAELLPGKIQNRYDELKDERSGRPKKKHKEVEIRNFDDAWENIERLYAKAVGAMNLLADAAEEIAEMKPGHYDEIFNRDMLAAIARPYDRLIVKWRPREEVRRRAEQAGR